MMRPALLVLLLTTQAIAAVSQAAPATISTTGTGTVTLTATRAQLTILTSARAPTAAAAADANKLLADRVLAELQGRPHLDSLRVTDVSLSRVQMFGDSLTLFEASADIEVTLRDLTTLGTVLDNAIRAGATGIGHIQYLADGMEKARREALALALAEALSDAEALATAAGSALGPLVSVTSGQRFPLGASFVGGFVSRSEPLTISPSGVNVRAVVQAEWQMLDPPGNND